MNNKEVALRKEVLVLLKIGKVFIAGIIKRICIFDFILNKYLN